MPFGNRRGSARGAFDDDEPDTSGRPKSGGLAKIVRAASFSRRKKNDETSSGSSSTQSSPTADGTPLKGWLSKRHNKEKSVSQQWGRRYFSVDGVRGTLSYAKGEAKTPSAILPLADISSVTPFDGHKHGAHDLRQPARLRPAGGVRLVVVERAARAAAAVPERHGRKEALAQI